MKRLAWVMVALMVLALPLAGAAQTGTGRVTGTVSDATGAVLPGVTVTLKAEGLAGAVRSTVTDSAGRYTFTDVTAGSYELSFDLAGFSKQASKVAVAAGQALTQETKLQIGGQTEQIQVTGSLIPRPSLEAMSPVTTLDIEELTYRGMARVEDLLASLPQVFAAQNSSVSNGASGTATVDLRYLGTQRTLVLIDGRRMASGDAFATAPDLNFIPSALVKRVDVLTGGASSVYGADAVAGVVNFVLDTDFEGVRGGVQFSGYQHNNRNALAEKINAAKGFPILKGNVWDNAPSDFNVALGGKFADRKGHASIYLDYRTNDAITKDRRDYTNCSVLGGMTMTGPTCGGSATWPAGRFSVYNADFSVGKNYVLDVNSPGGDQLRLRTGADVYNYAPANFMQRPDKRWAGGGFLNYEWNKKIQAYLDVMFMDDYTDAQIAPSGDFGNTGLLNCDNPMLSAQQRKTLCTDMGYGPTDMANVYIYRRNVEGGGRVSQLSHTSLRYSFGLKGDLNNVWSYNAYALQAEVHSPQGYANDLNYQNIQDALIVDGTPGVPSSWVCRSGNTGCAPWNIFKVGGVTQAALDYLSLPELLNSGTRTRVVSGKLTADLKPYGMVFPTASEGIKLALAGEYRQEYLFVNPDLAFRNALGAGSGGPTLPVEGKYDVKEFFTEALVPIVQNASGFKDLSLELGYRLSDYSSTGRHSTYKAQASWAPVVDLKLRAGFNRATRSPNVVELFTPQGLGLNGSQDVCAGTHPTASLAECQRTGMTAAQYGTVSENPAGQYNTLGGGNPNLTPEKADTFTGGLVITPKAFPGFTAALDYYNVKIDSTIGSLGADDIQNQCATTGNTFLCGLIHRDRLGTLWMTNDAYTITTNQNVGKLSSQGVDVTAAYAKSLGSAGSVNLNLIGTYLMHQKVDTGLYAYDCVGYFGNQCGIPTPKWRHLARLSWETNFHTTFSLGWRMIGGVTNDDGSPNPAIGDPGNVALLKANDIYTISARHYFDLGINYKLLKNYQIVVGVNNILDKEPPLAPGMSPNDYGAGFYNTYDSLGRYWHVSLQFNF
ncbi:MAG: TonB-dependent receptor [Acidobacteria bacterium]|nr:TonB-dependent receptor [Acidobacteriota bacterium]